MNNLFARRVCQVQESFIREILKITKRPEIISFAGGLPNPTLFPVQEIANSVAKVLQEDGQRVLQYSTSEGYLPLREYIAHRYWARDSLRVNPDEILITNGSQQGLDLIGKVFLEPGDQVAMESPGYLKIRRAYQKQRAVMISTIETHFPSEVRITRPDGGMFLWLTLPEGLSSLDLFEIAADLNVAFVPGTAFYVAGGGDNALRLNFSNASEAQIALGMKRLAQAVKIGLAN